MKFGFAFERSGENDNDEINVNACPTCTNNQNGQFSFTDNRSGQPTSGVAAANAALGLFDTYSELGQDDGSHESSLPDHRRFRFFVILDEWTRSIYAFTRATTWASL